MKYYYVYILECSDKSFYIGITNNLDKRVDEHNKGIDSDSYTNKRLPVKLMYYSKFNDILVAINFEKQIKKWSRAKKLALINNELITLKRLSRNKTDFQPDMDSSRSP